MDLRRKMLTVGGTISERIIGFAGDSLLGRIRLTFFALLAFNALAAWFTLAFASEPAVVKGLGLGALALVLGLLTAGLRRGGFWPGSSAIEALLLGTYLWASGDVALSLPIFYPALIVRSMYGTARQAWIRSGLYFAAFALALLVRADAIGVPLGPVVAMQLVGFPFIALVLYSLHRTVAEHENVARLTADNVRVLRQLESMKNTFLSATSHELRTPATVVRGMSEVLVTRGEQLPAAERERLQHRLAANAVRLTDLLERLLDVDRLTRGHATAMPQPVDLAELVRAVVDDLALADRHVEVPSGVVDACVDPDMVERIVENLVVNATKYTPQGTRIAVLVERQDSVVLLRVVDEGPGVPAEHREAIFEPFFRVDDHSPSPGTGVGLALVASFAQLHGGRAWVEEGPGGGASFHVTLRESVPAAPAVAGVADG